jgi:hypothetical protein
MKAEKLASFSSAYFRLHSSFPSPLRTFLEGLSCGFGCACIDRGYDRDVELAGDEIGIAALKSMHAKNKEYLKFLLGEIRSNTDLRASFSAEDGQAFTITLEPKSGKLQIAKKA